MVGNIGTGSTDGSPGTGTVGQGMSSLPSWYASTRL